MSRYEVVFGLCLFVLIAATACGSTEPDSTAFSYPEDFELGVPIGASTRQALYTTIPPDGSGLPEGSGTFERGAEIYRARCMACHGEDLGGTDAGMPLVGGRNTLASESPRKTVESYWPYATSVFSYIRNAMPVAQPGSLTDDEVYALMAFILVSAEIAPADVVMNRQALVDTRMPNRDGFVRDDRPDVEPVDVGD